LSIADQRAVGFILAWSLATLHTEENVQQGNTWVGALESIAKEGVSKEKSGEPSKC